MNTTARSPFHPTFGSTPPEFTGREAVIDAITDALHDGPGATARMSMIVGARGIGKTVTLNAVEDAAAAQGWLTISESVAPGLTTRLLRERIPLARREFSAPGRRRLTGITLPAGLGGFHLAEPEASSPAGLRDALADLVALVREHGGAGVLLTLDEVHGTKARGDLIDLADQIQHLVRRDTDIALVTAGLPAAVQDLLSEEVSTFLRRAKRFTLGALTVPETEDALAVPIRQGGRNITPVALADAVRTTRGYPYLIQIMGDLAWKHAPDGSVIGPDDVSWAARRAIAEMGAQVHAPALHDLSARDREFLAAMAQDDGPSATGEIAERMGRKVAYTSQYRARLIAAEMVRPAGHGYLDFALPYLREYLRAHDVGW